jgi:putative ABC transport system substrate-binding protein
MKTGNRSERHRRRDLIRLGAAAFLAVGVTAAWPHATGAQQPLKVPRVGWIWPGPSAGNPTEAAGFRQGLKELGYIEGQNITVEYRFGEGRTDNKASL